MFGKVQFPLPTVEKVAIEYHLDWLFRRFGTEPIQRRPTLTPDSDELQPFFADSNIARQGLLDFIASHYPFYCDGCEIAVWDGRAAPPLEPDLVLLSPEEHEHPVAMVNRMATHLAQRYIVRLPQTEWQSADFAMLSELLALYFGWGIFGANMTLITSMYTHGEWHEWKQQKYTQIAARQFGAALAYRSWLRKDPQEKKLDRYLRPDAQVPFRRALKYLRIRGDSLFNATNDSSVFVAKSLQELQPFLFSTSDSQTTAALRRVVELAQPGELLDDESAMFLYQGLPDWLNSRDPSIRILACRVADRFGKVEGEVLQCLKDRLSDTNAEIRQEATANIVYLAAPGQIQARDLRCSLKDNHFGTVKAAVQGIVYLQQIEEELVPDLLRLIRRGSNDGQDDNDLCFLVAALDTVCSNPEERLAEFLREDPEEMVNVTARLRDWRELSQQMGN